MRATPGARGDFVRAERVDGGGTMMRRVRLWRILLTLAMSGSILFSASAVSAQGVGSIFGKVVDASGGVLPGVTVTVAGPRLQQPLVAQTSASGTYQFPTVPIGTYSVTFELQGFKKAVRQNIIIDTGFNARVDHSLEVGALSEEVTVNAESPVVDLKKTTVGAVFDKDILEKIPSARDPWQIINMAPGVIAGLNVGGSSSGQQVGLESRGTNDNVQWNLDGANITDLSSNSSVMYYNFDSFDQIQVNNGGGDVTVQSSGLNINLVTKSGSNVFKGTFNTTYENDGMQGSNVTQSLFEKGSGGFLSGAPIHEISVYSIEAGGPIVKNRLWYWGAADRQDINAGVVNFFDPGKGALCGDLIAAQRTGSSALANAINFDNLGQVQKCLQNDKTLIKNLQWKINYQLTNAHTFQYGFVSDEKYRNRRGASATTAPEATTQQTSDKPWHLPIPSHTLQHTWVASDKLVFNSSFNYTGGGFFLDYQDFDASGQSRYTGATDPRAYMTGARADAAALWNQQSLLNRTTSFQSRSLLNSYQTVRKTWELKTDSTYFLTHKLGGDHSLKFGAGWRRAPILTFYHYSGGARANVQCAGNDDENCGNGQAVAPGSGPGLVPYQAIVYRDRLINNDWWTYFGYIQNEYSRGRWRIKGGLRYDWQQSKHLGGCVPANILVPDLLPAQCEEETQTDLVNGRDLQPFKNWSPRVSATYDLFGNGKTAVHASGSYYYDTKITLANSLSGLTSANGLRLTWGPNLSSGACSTTAGASCWNDANHDLIVQRDELIGSPTPSDSRFDVDTGVLRPAGNTVDPDTKIRRTREAIVGASHELLPNLSLGVDYIYRKYDRGTDDYTIGYEPGAPGFPLSQIYSDRHAYTDPTTGLTGYYYTVCQGCSRPSGVGTITMTSLQYDVYHGVDLTATKRFSNRWQMQVAATLQRTKPYYPTGSYDNPTDIEWQNGFNSDREWIFKANGAYTFPFDITLAANFIANQGDARVTSINGPGSVYGGISSATGRPTTISYGNGSLEVEPRGSTRLDNEKLLDMSVQKTFAFQNGRRRVKLMFDAFNVFNANTITDWVSDNRSNSGFTRVEDIVPPRVFRVGMQIGF
jgi:hypothetical protein